MSVRSVLYISSNYQW